MSANWGVAFLLAVWLAAAGVAVLARRRAPAGGTGLVLAYLVGLWLLHWPAAAIYVLPDYSNFDELVVEAGLRESVYAVVGLAVGVAVVAPFLCRRLAAITGPGPARTPDRRLAPAYAVTGLGAYLLLLPLFGRVPTLNALVAAMWSLLVVGLGLGCWHAWRRRRRVAMVMWLAAASVLPFFTIVAAGFLGYGTSALLIVLALLASFVRWRPWICVAAFAVIYLALSFYVTYMRDRAEIRSVVWGGEAAGARIEQLSRTVRDLEWFDVGDPEHLLRIDERLNQNVLVGLAVSQLQSGMLSYAAGETLWQAAIAVVPRVIWPGKPVVAGSMELVSTYTGMQFAEGTSVGVGQVLEFYINFGTPGVFLGFVLLGAVLTIVDSAAAVRLVRGNWHAFTLWYLPGIALLQPGGSLVEVTSSAGAAMVVAWVIGRSAVRPAAGAGPAIRSSLTVRDVDRAGLG